MFFDIKPESVIHCAAKVGGLKANMTQKGDFFYQNIMMNTNVIEEAKNNQVEKLVCFLSTCVFPDDVEYPLSPEKIHLGKPHFSNDAYAYAKRMADVQIQAYREQYGLNYFSVVPTNIYGPGDNYSLENGHVVPTLIHKFYLAKKNNQDVRIWGSGSPLREFIYSKDVADLTENLLKSYTGKDPVILSTSQEYSIKELASLIGELMEFEGDVIYESDKPDGQMRKPSDNSFVKSNFPDFHFTSLRLGLRRSIDWFIDHYPNTRK
jgi:GDP-L-fucose synthase